MAGVNAIRRDNIFLNVPFDARYERLFVTLVGTLVCLGQKPRCVLEIVEGGQGRLVRIFDLIQQCRTSVHDLSRVNMPVRFNMPFELGLAVALKLVGNEHQVVVLDAKPYRLDRVLSDYKGRDPLIHHNRSGDLVRCLLDVVEVSSRPSGGELRSVSRVLSRSAARIRHDLHTETLFTPTGFRALLVAATDVAVRRGHIEAIVGAAEESHRGKG
jgi:hypothetical protein